MPPLPTLVAVVFDVWCRCGTTAACIPFYVGRV